MPLKQCCILGELLYSDKEKWSWFMSLRIDVWSDFV